MLYFEDLQVGDTRVSGSHELREEEIISFARQWDPQPWHVDREAAARRRLEQVSEGRAMGMAGGDTGG